MAELAFLPAKSLALLVRRGRIGCLELLDHFIERVERLDQQLNSIVVRDFDRARKRARALDRRRGKEGGFGALFGVPMTVKESFDVDGLPTTWGLEDRRDHRADRNALAVDRLEAAGAVVFGKTNVPVALADWQSYNPIYGATSNPWNVEHTPGGSSGGAAAALAAGITGFEIGSDIGGSIRVPAHYCGVFGHKPTWGLCPMRGHSLSDAASMTDISVIGPLARSAEDLALGLGLLGVPDETETALTLTLPAPAVTGFEGLRVAVWAEQPGHATDTETVTRLQALATFFRRKGAKVSTTVRPAFDPTEAFHVYLRLLQAAFSGRMTEEAIGRLLEKAAEHGPEDVRAFVVMARAAGMSHREWLALNERRCQIRRAWGAFFQNWDVLFCPVISTAAIPHMREDPQSARLMPVNGQEIPYNDMLFWPGLSGGFHLPATTAPMGFTHSGLPMGVQIVGPLYGDRTTIAVARLIEREWQNFTPPIGFD